MDASGVKPSVPTGRLAAEATSFVDRQDEVAQVRQLVALNRLVTLTGVGGTGKTRLALCAAGELRRTFADGVWQVDLTELSDGSVMDFAVIEALSVPGATERPTAGQLPDYLADRELLLVLDNCEHVLDACAALVTRLLRAAPGLSVLCTSRQPLGMVGETVWTVPPLPVPAAPDGTETEPPDPARYPALALFVDRAAAADARFTLTADNVETVAAICRQLDGLPLAIELAAAQLRCRSLEQLATGLDDRFRILSSRHAFPTHHADLWKTFDWSYALCSPVEQMLWARLSVFTGFDVDGATVVCADERLPRESMLDAVAGLVDKSIVLREESTGAARYRLLGTVRAYGLDRLGLAEEERLRARHHDWYLRLAERFDTEWFGSTQPAWAARMRAESANLRAALGWSLTAPGARASGVRLATALRYHWLAGGALAEGRYWLRRVLDGYPEPTRLRVLAQSAYSRILNAQLDATEGAVSCAETLRLAHRLDDPGLLARAVQDLGIHELRCGDDPARARALLEEAVERHTAVGGGDPEGLVLAQYSLAAARLFQGDPDGADALCARCRQFCADRGEQWSRSAVLLLSALVARTQADPVRTAGYLRESLLLRRALGDVFGMAQTLETIAAVAADAGDSTRAAKLFGVTGRVWRSLGVLRVGSHHYQRQSQAATARARVDLGDEAFEAAIQDGWKLSPEEAFHYALEPEGVPAPEPAQPAQPSPLTPRERQVAQLIADGLSNKQIAVRLVIAQRTAESHVENILAKLGFTSRTQIAAWVARRQG